MDTKTTISMTEARKRIFDIAEAVQRPGVYYTLTEKGKPKVVVMSGEEFESWMETLEVMYEYPDFKNRIAAAERAYKKGQYVTLEQLLAKEGYTRYALPGRHTKASSKKARSR